MSKHCPQGKENKTVPFLAGVCDLGHTAGKTGTVSHALILKGGHNITLREKRHHHERATVRINARDQSIQTQNLFDLTLAGNTSGALALISSGTMTIAGGNNITLSQAGNAITISAAAIGTGSFSAGVSTGGNTSGTTGTVTNELVFVGGNNITLSQSINGQSGTITISASLSQSQQTQNIIRDVNIIGNTSGTTANITSGTLYLAGGNEITLSQVGNSITISAFEDTVTQFSIGVSTGGNTSGTTGTVDNRLILVGGNNITLSQSINGQSATITMNAHDHINALSLSGNTSGTLELISEGTIYLAGGNNITLSQDQHSVTISAFNQSQQTQNIIRDVNIGGNTSGTTADITSGTLRIVGGYNVTLSQNANTITISGGEVLTAVVSNLGNTAGLTGAPTLMDKLIFVGGDNITLSQTFVGEDVTITFNAQSQSTQTQNIINDVNIIGNTSGTTANITSGTLYLAGGNEITLSQVGNSITISAFEDTVTQFSIGVSTGGNTSGTTGTVDNRVILVGGNNITLSQSINGQSATITISAFGDTVTQYSAGMSTGGNTTGTTGLASQRLILAGGNNITLSGSINAGSMTITISAFENTVTQYSAGISNIGNTSGTSGLASQRIVFAGGNNITLSQSLDAGSATLTISAQSQSQQTQNIIRDVNISGNTSGTTADITSGTMTLAGGDNITLSQVGNAITISAAAVGAGSFSAGISTGGNTSGTSGTVANRLIFAGGDNITLSQSVNGQSATITISAVAVGAGSFSAGISTGGNTSGTSGTVANQLVFAGGNNITLSQSVNGQSATITVSTPDQSQQTQNIIRDVVISGNTSGTTANITSGTLTLAGGNGIILSQVGNAITISNHEISAGISNLGNTSGTTGLVHDQMVFVGGNNITLSQSINGQSATLTISAASDTITQFSAGMSNLGNSSGTTGTFDNRFILVGGNNITLIQSIDLANHSGTITISGQTIHEEISLGISNIGNTSGTTTVSDFHRYAFVGGNNITLSQSVDASSATLTISAFTQTEQTQNRFDLTLSGNTSGTLALVSSGTLTLAGGNNITLSQSGNIITISAFNQTVQTQNRFNLTLSGNTSGTLAQVSSGTLTLAGGNNITLNQDGNAVTISGGNSYSAGMSNLGNTSGTSNLVSQQLILVGGNNVTLSQSTNGGSATLTISGGNSYSAGVSTGGNTSGTTGLASQRLVFVGGNNITLSESTNGGSATVTISAPSDPTLSYWGYGDQNLDRIATSNGTFFLFPLVPFTQMLFPGNMTVSTALLDFSCSDSNASQSFTHSWKIGIYTINGATLSILNSVAVTWGSNQNSANTSLFSGQRFLTIHSSAWSSSPVFSRTMYYVGMVGNTSGNSVDFSIEGYNILGEEGIRSGTIGVGNTTGNTSMGWAPWVGVSASSRNITAGLPTNIQLSQLVKTGALYGFVPYTQFNNISSNF